MNYGKRGIVSQARVLSSGTDKWGKKFGLLGFYSLISGVLAVAIIGASAGLGVFMGVKDQANDYASKLETLATPKGFSTFVYDQEQNQIAKLDAADSNRVVVPGDKIPENMSNAFVAVEDERFYDHNGIDIHGIIRAGFKALSSGDMSQGASTITQQLIKNTVFSETWTNESKLEKIKRKIQEQFLAVELEKQQTKEQILVNYMNTIALGQSVYGVQAAAKTYFGKNVEDLDLSECAVIAGITQNPSKYDPRRHPENNKEKRNIVLDKMLAQGYIKQDEYDIAKSDDIYDRIKSVNEETEENKKVNSYFVDALIDDLINSLMDEEIMGDKVMTKQEAINEVYSGGLKVYSSQDTKIQNICDEIYGNPDNYPKGTKIYPQYLLTVHHKDGSVDNYNSNHLDKFMGGREKMIFKSKEDVDAAIEKFKEKYVGEGDTVNEHDESLEYVPQPQISLTVADQKTGQIVALIGGRGEKKQNRSLNRATGAKRQPGSTFKVIACFAPGIDHGDLTLATTFKDAEFHYDNGRGRAVKNHWGAEYRGLQSVRYAIIKSANVLTVEAYTYITPAVGADYLKNKFHFTTLTKGDLEQQATCLGGVEHGVYCNELNAAYATIANGGIYYKPHLFQKVLDHDGNVLIDNTAPEGERALKETSAYLLKSAMKDVVTKGTATSVNFDKSRDIAGKTGTTTSNVDVWFAGFTANYTATSWAGYDNNVHLPNSGEEHNLAKTMWTKVMKEIHADLEPAKFEVPDGIVKMDVCARSGLRPTNGCEVINEIFDKDNVPGESEMCDVHVGGGMFPMCLIDHKPACPNCPFQTTGEKDPMRLEKIKDGFAQPLNFGGDNTGGGDGFFDGLIGGDYCHHDAGFMMQGNIAEILTNELIQNGYQDKVEQYQQSWQNNNAFEQWFNGFMGDHDGDDQNNDYHDGDNNGGDDHGGDNHGGDNNGGDNNGNQNNDWPNGQNDQPQPQPQPQPDPQPAPQPDDNQGGDNQNN